MSKRKRVLVCSQNEGLTLLRVMVLCADLKLLTTVIKIYTILSGTWCKNQYLCKRDFRRNKTQKENCGIQMTCLSMIAGCPRELCNTQVTMGDDRVSAGFPHGLVLLNTTCLHPIGIESIVHCSLRFMH